MEIHKNIKNIFDIGSRVDKIAVLVVYLFLLLSVDAFSTAVYKCVETILKLLDLPCYSVHWSGSPISLLKASGLGSLASSADEEKDQKCSCSCRCRQIFWGEDPFLKASFHRLCHTLEHGCSSGPLCPSRFSWGPTARDRWIHFPPLQVKSVHEGSKGHLQVTHGKKKIDQN